MTTKFAALNSYPRFGISPHMSTFSMAPRQNRHLSLPRIEVLVESDDSDDEGSYHSMHLKAYERARAPSPDGVDDLEKKGLVSDAHDPPVKKKPTDTTNKWDYYVAPLSPLTESDASDTDDDTQSKSAETPSRVDETPCSNARVGPATDPRQSPPVLKRKRSCDFGITPTSEIKDSEGPRTKRPRRMSGTSERSSEAESSMAARPALSESMFPQQSKRNIRRQGMVAGTIRKPRVVSLRQKRARSKLLVANEDSV